VTDATASAQLLDPRVVSLAHAAKSASRPMARASTKQKDLALTTIASLLRARSTEILAANAIDVAAGEASGLAPAMIDRLVLTTARLESLARAVEEIASLADPIGSVDSMTRRPSGILVGRMRVPVGVVAMIYESRPNVTVDAAVLALKAGNAVLLRGGKEAQWSNEALAACVHSGLEKAGLPREAAALVPTDSRETTRTLLQLTGVVDLAIPRGGDGLVRFVAEHARVPVIGHFAGVCHLFVDAGYDVDNAIALVIDGKAKRPGVCNALETLLVHASIADALLPKLDAALVEHGVEARAEITARARMLHAKLATEDDFGHEFLAKVLAIKIVASLDEAIDHVARFGSNHSEAIATHVWEHAQRWQREVDASCVLVNASTRFNDGGELGLGAELGISTSKLHAYGPMGLEELTTRKWIVQGDGAVRG
jgi:glutamate-5-semialdehyde dehydrogenase